MGSYDLAAVFVTLPLSFIGSKGNRPVYLAIAACMVGCGSFISCLPHFVTGVYKFGEFDEDTCVVNGEDTCVVNGEDTCVINDEDTCVINGENGQKVRMREER